MSYCSRKKCTNLATKVIHYEFEGEKYLIESCDTCEEAYNKFIKNLKEQEYDPTETINH